ncbi:caspase 8, apoptosis-related cysteine peptidase, like 1 isoform X1 [Danio rerio]|uniref:Caspase 8, apoptosis-related cysteine peptidase, like 1 isoform X1 n=1 Tax=Danio rerio TaxID=7955 RepID=A0A8M2BD38_DANRE
MDKTSNPNNSNQINRASPNEQEKIKTDEPKRKNTSQEDKENLHKGVQNNNSPKRQREPLQSTCNISDHYPKRKRAVTEQKEWYSMSNRPLGYCLIINNYKFESASLADRRGTDRDKDDLTKVFEKMYFKVEVRDDLQASDMRNVIKEFAEKDHSQMNAFVCCILTHGEKGTVLGTDGKQVPIRELSQPFAECRSLASKPKLFFIQACQGNMRQQGLWMAHERENTTEEEAYEEDAHAAGNYSIPMDADFLFAIATVEHFRSYRHITNGSIFIQVLCKQLERGCAQKKDILSILTAVNGVVGSKILQGYKQMPEVRYTLTKALVLPMNGVS